MGETQYKKKKTVKGLKILQGDTSRQTTASHTHSSRIGNAFHVHKVEGCTRPENMMFTRFLAPLSRPVLVVVVGRGGRSACGGWRSGVGRTLGGGGGWWCQRGPTYATHSPWLSSPTFISASLYPCNQLQLRNECN